MISFLSPGTGNRSATIQFSLFIGFNNSDYFFKNCFLESHQEKGIIVK